MQRWTEASVFAGARREAVFSEKYDITRHPRYKYLSDADKKNTFDVDSYLSSLRRKRRRVITEDEPFDLYDIELSEEDFPQNKAAIEKGA